MRCFSRLEGSMVAVLVCVCCSKSGSVVEMCMMLNEVIASHCQHFHGAWVPINDPAEAQVPRTNGRMTESTFVGVLGHRNTQCRQLGPARPRIDGVAIADLEPKAADVRRYKDTPMEERSQCRNELLSVTLNVLLCVFTIES